MTSRGLAADGTIAREGSPDRVEKSFTRVVVTTRDAITVGFARSRLHSAYLYGSVPRGTARPGVSDLDLLVALNDEPTAADHARARTIEAALDRDSPQIDGVGIVVAGAGTLLSERERHDLGFFVACLCTPFIGDDLAAQLPRYRPTSLLARETNGDLAALLPRWRAEIAAAVTDGERQLVSARIARRVVRTGFTLVMPRWGGWTSDLGECTEVFGAYHPGRAGQMRAAAAATDRTRPVDPALQALLLDDLGPWLAGEYHRVHGDKAPRPEPRPRPLSNTK